MPAPRLLDAFRELSLSARGHRRRPIMQLGEGDGAQVALASVREHDDDELAGVLGSARHLPRADGRGSATEMPSSNPSFRINSCCAAIAGGRASVTERSRP